MGRLAPGFIGKGIAVRAIERPRFKGFRRFRGFRGGGIAFGDEFYSQRYGITFPSPTVILSTAKDLGTRSI